MRAVPLSNYVTGWAIVSHVGDKEVIDDRYRTNVPDFVAKDIASTIVGVPVLIGHVVSKSARSSPPSISTAKTRCAVACQRRA